MKRRTFLIGSVSGISLLAVSACTSSPPTPTPTIPTVPATVPQPSAFRRTEWSSDPFSRGSFSFQAVDSSPEDRIAMRQPIDDRVFFAGEATSEANPGTVYGARVSGMRAAVEVLAAGNSDERITIIGAGIAGATAARRLTDEGYAVVVVEARERAGGRIHSVQDDDWPATIELGAAWIREPSSTILSELERLEIGTALAQGGEEPRTPAGASLEPRDIGKTAVTEALIWAADQPSDTSLADALRESGAGDVDSSPGPSGVAETDWLDHYLETAIAAERAADPDDLSAWYATDPLLTSSDQDRIVTGGYQKLVADALTDIDVLPSSAVVSVTSTDNGVSLRLARGESLSADRVIVTVPLGVLKSGSIEFDPPLPFGHRGAIDALGMGNQEKVVLRFDQPFWSTRAIRWGTVGGDTDFPLWFNLQSLIGDPVLVALVGGEAAARVAEMSDRELLEAALASLEPFIDPDLLPD